MDRQTQTMKKQMVIDNRIDDVVCNSEKITNDIVQIKRTFKQFTELNTAMNKIENDQRLVQSAMDNMDRTHQTIADNLRLGLDRVEH